MVPVHPLIKMTSTAKNKKQKQMTGLPKPLHQFHSYFREKNKEILSDIKWNILECSSHGLVNDMLVLNKNI